MSQVKSSRREFVKASGVAGVVGVAGIAGVGLMETQKLNAAEAGQDYWVFVGTYTKKMSKGIYRLTMNGKTGALSGLKLVAKTAEPSFVAPHPNGRWLFAVNETTTFDGESAGSVSAFQIDKTTGDLKAVGKARSTHGSAPCYVSVDASGKFVLVANYHGGNLAVFRIGADGSLSEASDVVQHQGSSVNPKRQGEPHAHSILPDAKGQSILAADLGIDQVMGYRLDESSGKLVAHQPSTIQVEAGSGPRHLAISDDGKHAYAINELNSTVTAMDYDRASGKLQVIQTLSTLPADYTGNNGCADLHLSPDGRFLYGSNRGHDSIAIYAVDQASGRLTARGHAMMLGKTPRNFGIDPTGRFLLAANQNSDSITTFKINADTGALTATGSTAEVPTPVCVRFLAKGH